MGLFPILSSTIYNKPLLSPVMISHASILKSINNQVITNQRFKYFAVCKYSGLELTSYDQPTHSWLAPSMRRGCLSPVLAVNSKTGSGDGSSSEEEDGDDPRAMETVIKLYSALKNRSLSQLSEIIDDECHCVFNFGSFVQPFHGKEQVLSFFNSLISSMGHHFEFVVEPTLHKGTSVGVRWKIAWEKNYEPLGNGFGVNICQNYGGDMFIRNIEMVVEPLLHLEPMRLKMMAYAMAIPVVLSPDSPFEHRITTAFGVLLALLVAAAALWNYLRQ